MLERYRRYLQADAYGGYDGIYQKGAVEVGCMAHARRGFWKARTSDPAPARAMLEMIRDLYKIERELHGRSPEERLAARRVRSTPILDRMNAWLDREALAVLPKSPIGKAITYATNQWTALCRFVEDGRLEIDNNAAGRAIRPAVIWRRTSFGTQSESGRTFVERMLTVVTSLRLQKRNVLEFVTAACKAALEGCPPPSLLPE